MGGGRLRGGRRERGLGGEGRLVGEGRLGGVGGGSGGGRVGRLLHGFEPAATTGARPRGTHRIPTLNPALSPLGAGTRSTDSDIAQPTYPIRVPCRFSAAAGGLRRSVPRYRGR